MAFRDVRLIHYYWRTVAISTSYENDTEEYLGFCTLLWISLLWFQICFGTKKFIPFRTTHHPLVFAILYYLLSTLLRNFVEVVEIKTKQKHYLVATFVR